MNYDLTHHGVYAFILNEKQTEILLIQKSIGPYKGLLDLPGGTPELSETPEQTVIREVKEETGAEVNALLRQTKFDLIVDYNKQGTLYKLNHTGVVFQATLRTNILPSTKSSDTDGCIWFPLIEVTKDKVALPTLSVINDFISG